MLEAKNTHRADEHREFPHGHLDVVELPGLEFGVATFEPGWRWSESVKPIAGTEYCEFAHKGYVLSGRLHIRMADGPEQDFGPGDVFVCSPGHDAWVVGDEPAVVFDFAEEQRGYAKPKG
ncbi:cupin domain-containing protein [Allostreptomyces psammosilenae]|uniref:(S)-ureidoglycine aminohydrolase cupin domain-containing protein n=1 Tax=Allostreptomyces psammosilenae TaxID=1892865 RepID=A0A853A459_9ACTN|nr:cupin domain-containing protein [Allostreptomyces psammosilenae]NYI05282.1 hypothetical protein [Allostreptomyces psammosilenae]